MKTFLLILVAFAVLGIVYRFLPKTPLEQVPTAPIVAVPVPVADSSKYWKAKYDSLYGVWTEARERIFTKRKYQKLINSHEQIVTVGAL
ncbi:hypothetical protein DR864_27195 [Runella rosea]|uniref:Uncharacterized protein n=1 Tax=Runella rosea TaxID=2259595 RepID=A0A344TR88_9BACT|nr:hypothetical protein [Runella rosea]AXE21159.1 hypothetical protein DR864_27195 [Runella rosea]